MDDSDRSTTRRLTKQPPSAMPSSRSLRSQSSTNNIGRNQSTTSKLPSISKPQRANSIDNNSSQPSLSPSLSSSSFTPSTPSSFSNRVHSDESFDNHKALDTSTTPGYQASLRRPGPPPLSHTSPDSRMLTPSLRQSASFSTGDRSHEVTTPTRSETSFGSSKRYSDDSNGAASTGKVRFRKKSSGVSGFISSVLGSPRNVKISAPENPVHMIHVGYDNETGQFTVSFGNQSSLPSPTVSSVHQLDLLLTPLQVP